MKDKIVVSSTNGDDVKSDMGIKADKLKDILTEAPFVLVYCTYEVGGTLTYEVTWDRPKNSISLVATRLSPTSETVKVRGSGGEWEYKNGKLIKEKVLDNAKEEMWDKVKAKVDEVALATYKVK